MNDVANETAVIGKTPKFDFPTWLPPMLVKELRQGLRARGFMISLIGLHTALVIAFVWSLVVQIFDKSAGLGMVNGFFWTFTFVMLVFVMPLRGLAGLRPEIEARNVDLLMLTQLTSWRIVWGKWTSLVTQAALLLVTLLPYGVMRYFFGGVDLLQDVGRLGWLYVFSCMATALMLWVSGLNRILRVLLVVVLVLFLNGIFGTTFYGLMRHGFGGAFGSVFGRGGSLGEPVVIQLCWLFDMALVLLFCLLQAVRRISPPSENHSLTTRLLALAVMLPVPFLMFFRDTGGGVREAMGIQTVAGLVAFMLVCLLELATVELPMAVHVRQLAGRGGRFRRFLCMLFLPGWTGAAFFTAMGLAFFSALLWAGAFPDPMGRLKLLRVFGLAWIAVTAPAALMSLFLKRGRIAPMIVYGLMQSAAVLFSIFGGFLVHETRHTEKVGEMIESVFRVLPVTSYWFEIVKMTDRHDSGWALLLCEQIVMCVLSVCFMAICSRPFFRAYRAGVKSIKIE